MYPTIETVAPTTTNGPRRFTLSDQIATRTTMIPAHTKARYMVRAKTIGDLDDIRDKVLRCFEAGALATGSKLEIVGGKNGTGRIINTIAMMTNTTVADACG